MGGSAIASYINTNHGDAEGAFVWGAYVNAGVEDPAKNYPVPILTVGAELDGWMARITRIAEAYDQMKSSSVGYDTAKLTHPVVLVPGLNHASFLTGTPPSAVQETDLRAEIPIEEAIKQVVRCFCYLLDCD